LLEYEAGVIGPEQVRREYESLPANVEPDAATDRIRWLGGGAGEFVAEPDGNKQRKLTPAGSTRSIVTCSNARQAELQIQFNSGSCLPRWAAICCHRAAASYCRR
jgi:hypothetical protein